MVQSALNVVDLGHCLCSYVALPLLLPLQVHTLSCHHPLLKEGEDEHVLLALLSLSLSH